MDPANLEKEEEEDAVSDHQDSGSEEDEANHHHHLPLGMAILTLLGRAKHGTHFYKPRHS